LLLTHLTCDYANNFVGVSSAKFDSVDGVLECSIVPAGHVYEIRPRKDYRGVDLISDALPFGRLWYGEPDAASNAVGYAKFYSRSHG
jgi:hypothetical protein